MAEHPDQPSQPEPAERPLTREERIEAYKELAQDTERLEAIRRST